jgi:hypothetical protein
MQTSCHRLKQIGNALYISVLCTNIEFQLSALYSDDGIRPFRFWDGANELGFLL